MKKDNLSLKFALFTLLIFFIFFAGLCTGTMFPKADMYIMVITIILIIAISAFFWHRYIIITKHKEETKSR